VGTLPGWLNIQTLCNPVALRQNILCPIWPRSSRLRFTLLAECRQSMYSLSGRPLVSWAARGATCSLRGLAECRWLVHDGSSKALANSLRRARFARFPQIPAMSQSHAGVAQGHHAFSSGFRGVCLFKRGGRLFVDITTKNRSSRPSDSNIGSQRDLLQYCRTPPCSAMVRAQGRDHVPRNRLRLVMRTSSMADLAR